MNISAKLKPKSKRFFGVSVCVREKSVLLPCHFKGLKSSGQNFWDIKKATLFFKNLDPDLDSPEILDLE
jgi:hypothetical protein